MSRYFHHPNCAEMDSLFLFLFRQILNALLKLVLVGTGKTIHNLVSLKKNKGWYRRYIEFCRGVIVYVHVYLSKSYCTLVLFR